MSKFNPIKLTIDPRPEDQPDHLAGAVLHSLAREYGGSAAWGAVRTCGLAVLSFGLIPILMLPKLFRDFIGAEQQTLWHFAEWMRLRSGQPESTALVTAANRLRFRGWLRGLSMLALMLTIIPFAMHFSTTAFVLEDLIETTYGSNFRATPPFGIRLQTETLFAFWTAGLFIAYGFHWLQVQSYQGDVRRFVREVNKVSEAEGLTPIRVPDRETGITLGSIIVGVILVFMGAVWAIPMVMAQTAQKRYIDITSFQFRTQLAYRVRSILLVQRPALNVPKPYRMRRVCVQPGCRATLPDEASFCPRCGTRGPMMMNYVA